MQTPPASASADSTLFFVAPQAIVRRIWGRADTILFIFAGAAAEFALNKAVDWLYFTGKLPADPLGRLFSTVAYARKIVFAPQAEAEKAIAQIYQIHRAVEGARGSVIPDWAYRDVLFLLIHYSIAAFELLERRLSDAEKEEVYNVFYRVGLGLQLTQLAPDYKSWLAQRKAHLAADLQYSAYTQDLFRQYKKHLGVWRYAVLSEAQLLVVPDEVRRLMGKKRPSFLLPFVPLYRWSRKRGWDRWVKAILLPPNFKAQILALDT